MENLNTDQVLIWVLIIIALGAVAWAALQNWFFNQNKNNNEFLPHFSPYGAYPPNEPYAPKNGNDYPHLKTPRRNSPLLTLVLVIVAGVGLFKWVSGIKLQDAPGNGEMAAGFWESTPPVKTVSSVVTLDNDKTRQPNSRKENTAVVPVPESYDAVRPSVKLVTTPENKPAAPERITVPEAGFTIQVAALENISGFERLAVDLRKRFPKATIFRHISEIAPGVYGDKLLIGRFKSREAALEGVKKLGKKGYKNCFPVDFERIDMVEVYEVK